MTGEGLWRTNAEFTLSPGEVHVWRADLDVDDEALLTYRHSLAPEEEARADRFHFDEHRRRFIAGRGALRSLIGSYTHTPPREVRFAYSSHGKPAIHYPTSQIRFNLSHSDNLLVATFADTTDLGVDIEKIEDRSLAVLDISERFFTPEEHDHIQQQEGRSRTEAFLQFWTAKEAIMKSTGLGLSLEPNAIALALDPLRIVSIRSDVSPDWKLVAFQPAPGFVGTLSIRPTIEHSTFFEWTMPSDSYPENRSIR